MNGTDTTKDFISFAEEYLGKKPKEEIIPTNGKGFISFAEEYLGKKKEGFISFAEDHLGKKVPEQFEEDPPPAGHRPLAEYPEAEPLKAEIPPPEVERKAEKRFADAYLASDYLQKGKKFMYVAHKFLDTATLGLVNKLVDRSEFESMPKDVATVVAGELAHFAGFLTGPVKLAKIPVKAFAKGLGKVVKNPKVLNWLRYGTEHVGTLALASPISDVTDIQSFKDFAEKAGSGAALGAVFAGTGLASFMKSPTLNRIIRQVGSRAVGNLFKVYSPDVVRWEEMSEEERAKAVFDEILFSYFSWKGVKPSAVSRQGMEEKIRSEAEGRRPEEIVPKELSEADLEAKLVEIAKKSHDLGIAAGDLPKEVSRAADKDIEREARRRLEAEIEEEGRIQREAEKPEEAGARIERMKADIVRGEEMLKTEAERPPEVAELEPERPPTAKPVAEEAKIPAIEKEPVKKSGVGLEQKTNEELESMVKYGIQKEKAQAELDRRYLGEAVSKEPEKKAEVKAKEPVEPTKTPYTFKDTARAVQKEYEISIADANQLTKMTVSENWRLGLKPKTVEEVLDIMKKHEKLGAEEAADFVFEEAEPIKPAIVKEPVSRQEVIEKAAARKPAEPAVEPDALLKQTEAYLLEKGVPRENWGAIIDRVKKKGFDPSKKEPLENYLAKTVKYFEEGQPRGRGPTKAGPREEQVFEGREKEREEPVSRKQITAEETAWGKKELSPEEIYEAKERKKGVTSAIKKSLKRLNPEIRAVAEGVMKEETIDDMAERMKVSHTTVRNRIAEMAEAMSKDPELKKWAEENIEAAEKAKDGKNIPLLRKYAGLDPGSIELKRLPASVQDLVSLMSKKYKTGNLYVRDLVRLPQWSPHYEAITKKIIDRTANEPRRVEFKGYRMAWGYLKDKNKEPYHKARAAEEELGRRLTVPELKQLGLSDQQIKNFKGAIRAFDFYHKYSIMLMRKVGVPENKAEAEKIKWEGKTIEDFKKEKNPAFWPHRRHGNYVVFLRARKDVIGRKGVRVEYSSFKTESLAKERIEKLIEQGRKNKVVENGIEYALFKRGDRNYRVPMTELEKLEPFDKLKHFEDIGSFFEVMRHLPILEQIFKRKGIEFAGMEELTRVLGREVLTKFAGGAFAKRAGVPGESKDYARGVEEYLSSVPHALAKRYYRGEIEEMRQALPSKYRDYAGKQIKYVMGEEKREGPINQGLRRFFYDFYLAFKLSFGGLNLTQRLQTTFPMAQAKGGAAGIISLVKAQGKEIALFTSYAKSGFKDLKTTIRNAKFLSVAEKRTLARMYEADELGAARIRDITGVEIKKEPTKAFGRWVEQGAQIIGFGTERSNRIVSALTDVDISMNKGLRKIGLVIESAEDFTGKTQWIYDKATRMKVARGTLAPLFVFKSFINNYFRMQGYLFRNNKPAFVTANAIMLGLAGSLGFPAYNVLRDLTLSGLRAAGIISKDEELMKQAHDIEESIKESGWLGEAIMEGFPAALGFEGEWVWGVGELFDFAPVSLAKSWYYFTKNLISPKAKNLDMLESFARISPTALAHLMRWYQVAVKKKMPSGVTGIPKLTDQSLKTLPKHLREYARALYADLPTAEDISAGEKALYAIGFPTKKMARYGTEVYYIKKLARKVKDKKSADHEYIGKAIANLNISPKRIKTANVAWYRINLNRFLRMMDEDTRNEVKRLIAKYKKKDYPLSDQAILDWIKKHI